MALQWIAVLVPSLICASFLDYGFSCILFSALVLIPSSIFFILSKQKQVLSKKDPVKDEANSSDQLECLPQVVEEVVPKLELEKESSTTFSQTKQGQECEVSQIDHFSETKSIEKERTFSQTKRGQECEACQIDQFSESESIDHSSSTSEDSELDCPFSCNVDRCPDCSDGSISDEESLIEIALPSGQYVGAKQMDLKFQLQPKMPHFSPVSIFRKHSLVELLAEINEMNEEDNLIEIDISIGCIKCSRFEIKA